MNQLHCRSDSGGGGGASDDALLGVPGRDDRLRPSTREIAVEARAAARGCLAAATDAVQLLGERVVEHRRGEFRDRGFQQCRRIPRKIKDALEAMLSGKAKNLTQAAKAAGISREHLSRTLSARPEIVVWAENRARRVLGIGATVAAAKMLELVHSNSSRSRQAGTSCRLPGSARPQMLRCRSIWN